MIKQIRSLSVVCSLVLTQAAMAQSPTEYLFRPNFPTPASLIAQAQTGSSSFQYPSNESCINSVGQVISCPPDQPYDGRNPKQNSCKEDFNHLELMLGKANGLLWGKVERSSSNLPNNPEYRTFEYPQFIQAQNTLRRFSQPFIETLRKLSYTEEWQSCQQIRQVAESRLQEILRINYQLQLTE